MESFKNLNRLRRLGKQYPRPTLDEGLRQTADAALDGWQPGQVLPFRVAPADPHGLIFA